MHDDRYVFGISTDLLRDRAFAFVRVDAILEDRRLRTDFDRLEEFPTDGDIFVAERFLPEVDAAAIWRVRRSEPRSDARYAGWTASGRGPSSPFEVISLHTSSSRISGVRQQLLEGIELGYIPASQVLVRLLDGIVVGPVRGSRYEEDNSYGFRCLIDAFVEPLRVWDSAHLATFHVDASYAVERQRRTFLSSLDLPPSERFIDFADFADSVKAVLKAKATRDSRTLTPGLIRDIAAALRTEDYPDSVRERVTRVRRAVQSLAITDDELDALMPEVLANPEVIKRIDVARQSAAEEERRRIGDAKQGAAGELRRLLEQEQALRKRIAILTDEASTAEKSAVQAADAAVDAVRGRVQEAIANVGKLLSDVALLRPFLTSATSQSTTHGSSPALALQFPARDAIDEIEDAPEADPETAVDYATRLSADLKTGGLGANASACLAREVMAALLAGQIPILIGSFAGLVIDALSRALAGRRTMVIDVPLGLLSDELLTAAVHDAVRLSDDLQGLLVCRGIDRSALDLYAGGLRDSVARRVLRNDFESPPLAFLASMCGGPACLPISPGLFDLGPVFDTDTLTYSPREDGRVPLRRAISRKKWLEWRTKLSSFSKEWQDRSREACDLLSAGESKLWQRGVESAAGFVLALSDGHGDDVSAAILARWIVPRALAEGQDPDDIAAHLKTLGFEEQLTASDGRESPVAALLERARKIRKLGT